MRIWGRNSEGTWVKVETDSGGFNDAVYVTNLIQVLKLNTGESPFYASHGIPSQRSVISQIFPNYAVQQVQNQFSRFFTSLLISKIAASENGVPYPFYKINVLTNQGASISVDIPV